MEYSVSRQNVAGATVRLPVTTEKKARQVARVWRAAGDVNVRVWRRQVGAWQPCAQSEFPGDKSG